MNGQFSKRIGRRCTESIADDARLLSCASDRVSITGMHRSLDSPQLRRLGNAANTTDRDSWHRVLLLCNVSSMSVIRAVQPQRVPSLTSLLLAGLHPADWHAATPTVLLVWACFAYSPYFWRRWRVLTIRLLTIPCTLRENSQPRGCMSNKIMRRIARPRSHEPQVIERGLGVCLITTLHIDVALSLMGYLW